MKKEVEFAKELDECLEALIAVAKGVKAKQSIAEISAGALPKLFAAVEGFDKVDDEFKLDPKAFAATLGYRAGELAGVFLEKPAAEEPNGP